MLNLVAKQAGYDVFKTCAATGTVQHLTVICQSSSEFFRTGLTDRSAILRRSKRVPVPDIADTEICLIFRSDRVISS